MKPRKHLNISVTFYLADSILCTGRRPRRRFEGKLEKSKSKSKLGSRVHRIKRRKKGELNCGSYLKFFFFCLLYVCFDKEKTKSKNNVCFGDFKIFQKQKNIYIYVCTFNNRCVVHKSDKKKEKMLLSLKVKNFELSVKLLILLLKIF